MPVRKLTADFVKRAVVETGKDRTIYWDSKLEGFGLQVTDRGAKSWKVQYRYGHRSPRITISAVLDLDEARKQAKMILGAVAKGDDPASERRKSADIERNVLRAIIAEYFEREGNKLRTTAKRRSALERLVVPKLGGWSIYDIRRSDIQRLLDEIEAHSGVVAADQVLKFLSRIFGWFAMRADDFQSPIIRGMSRVKPKDIERQRTLTDDEIRAVWTAAESFRAPWGAFIRMLLLTCARRTEMSDLQWSEMSNGDIIVPGRRTKSGKDFLLPLSKAAQAVLAELPRFQGCDFAFSVDGIGPITGFSDFKAEFDKACGVTDWRLHDLRRTARTLISRAGVAKDIGEYCLSHTKTGVHGTYDTWEYRDEKLLAFERLSSLIQNIVRPTENVVALRGSAG